MKNTNSRVIFQNKVCPFAVAADDCCCHTKNGYTFLRNITLELLGMFEKTLNVLMKFDRKIEFYLFLEMLMLKVQPSEITTFFYKNYFNFAGGGRSLCSAPSGA